MDRLGDSIGSGFGCMVLIALIYAAIGWASWHWAGWGGALIWVVAGVGVATLVWALAPGLPKATMRAYAISIAAARRIASERRALADAMERAVWIEGPGTFEFEIVGESHYQEEIERLNGGRSRNPARKVVEATLHQEDDNPHDEMAVRVEVRGRTVGYLARREARAFRRRYLLDYPMRKCEAIIVGGWDRGRGDRGSFGIRLDIPPLPRG